MSEKLPGHEVLRRAATAITGAKLGYLRDTQKKNLVNELGTQIYARRDDFIPEEHRLPVITEVLTAASLMGDIVGSEVLALAESNLSEEQFHELVAGLDGDWVLCRCDAPECPCLHLVTLEAMAALNVKADQYDRAPFAAILEGFFEGSPTPPPLRLTIVWAPPGMELPVDNESEAETAADETDERPVNPDQN